MGTLKFTKNDGLDLIEEDWKKKLEEPKSELEPLTKLMKKVIDEKVEKATSERQNRRFTLRSEMFGMWLVRREPDTLKPSTDRSHKIAKEDLVWPFFHTSVLTSGFNLSEAT